MATAIPTITEQFKSLDDVGWYGSAYLITSCSMYLIFGKLYALLPIKTTYLVSLSIFEIGSLVCAVTPNSLGLILGRAVAGIGAAAIFSGSIIIISRSVPLHQRPIYMGFITGVSGISSVAGPL